MKKLFPNISSLFASFSFFLFLLFVCSLVSASAHCHVICLAPSNLLASLSFTLCTLQRIQLKSPLVIITTLIERIIVGRCPQFHNFHKGDCSPCQWCFLAGCRSLLLCFLNDHYTRRKSFVLSSHWRAFMRNHRGELNERDRGPEGRDKHGTMDGQVQYKATELDGRRDSDR